MSTGGKFRSIFCWKCYIGLKISIVYKIVYFVLFTKTRMGFVVTSHFQTDSRITITGPKYCAPLLAPTSNYLYLYDISFPNILLLPPANEIWCKVIFLVACQEFCSQGMLGYHTPRPGTPQIRHPPDQAPPRPGTPRSRPPKHTRLGRHPRSRHPPCSACWEIWSTSGRYASSWNAILF